MSRRESPARVSLLQIGLVGVVGTLQVMGGSAHAQSQTPAGQAASAANVDEVIVTAQRREERLVDVPLSVSAVSGNTLASIGVTQVTQLQNIVPSLDIADAGPVPKVGIRGIALNDFGQSNESPVAVYFNDVYIGSTVSPLSQIYDIDRVEVLRGPQGTLFGRNATGGLIQIITKKPTADESGQASFQIGSFGQTILQLSQNVPLSPSVRTRTAIIYNHDDGWQKNVVNGSRLASTNLAGIRETVDVDLSPSVTNSTVLHYGWEKDASNDYAFRGTMTSPTGAKCTLAAIQANQCVTSDGFRNPNPKPQYIYSSLVDPLNYLQTYGVDNTLKYSGNGVNLTSVTAYEKTDTKRTEDDGGTADPIDIITYQATREQFSQEFRADGEINKLKWVAGAYYFYERLPHGYVTAPNLIKAFGTTVGFQNQYNQTEKSAAVFGQADYKILPSLTLTGGLRYTDETRELTITDTFQNPSFINTYKPKADKVTWKAGAQWQIQDRVMAYASVSTGFKSSAFNTLQVGPNQAVPARPEEDLSYEIGLKGETEDHRFQGSLAAFHTDYKYFQLISTDASTAVPVTTLLNVPKADIDGVEAEFTARPIGGLMITGNVAELDTKVHAPDVLVSTFPSGKISIDGMPLTLSPKFSAKGMIRYDFQTSHAGVFSPWVDGSYKTKAYSKLPANPLDEIPAYALFNAGVTWALPDGRWKLDLLVENVANKAYLTQATYFSGLDFERFGKVRTFAIKASTSW